MQLNCNPGFEASKKEKNHCEPEGTCVVDVIIRNSGGSFWSRFEQKKIGNARELPAKPPTFQLALEC